MEVNGKEREPMSKPKNVVKLRDLLDVRIICDGALAEALRNSAKDGCRSIQQEVRYRLRQAYAMKEENNGPKS